MPPLDGGIELCGSSSCLGALRSMLNTEGINLSKKELTPEEKSLPQKGPEFAVTPPTIPIKEYISTTTVAALQAGEFSGLQLPLP